MTPEQLSTAIVDVLTTLSDEGAITLPDGVPTTVTVERPRQKGHGDYATNVALQLAKKAGHEPARVRRAGERPPHQGRRDRRRRHRRPGLPQHHRRRRRPGRGRRADRRRRGVVRRAPTSSRGEKINLEFVSANPTGPIHIGGVRWAAVGDALGRIFEKTGAEVTREYYFNDHGAQIDRFSRSLLASAKGEPAPEDGYGGDYIHEIAAAVVARRRPEVKDLPDDEAQEVFRAEGVEMMFEEIKKSLHDFGVDFDVYFHENNLHKSGAVERAIARLTEMGNTYEKDGALWLRTEKFGDDKDRVIIKSDGQGAYISGDLAYYLDKRERGFDRCFIMLGADHHGYVGRMKAMCAAFGDEPGKNLEILIGQMVNLLSDGEPLRMSKRAGTVVTIDDLVEAIGVDASRYALARYSSDSNIDLDLDLWAKQSNDNPVYYVQYAHARVSGILRNAGELGIEWSTDDFDPSLLSHEKEGELLRALAEFPRVVVSAAELREPHRVARYLEDTAGVYHRFYDNCRVLPMGDEETNDLHRARLVLVAATRTVLANGLDLLGVSAPERM